MVHKSRLRSKADYEAQQQGMSEPAVTRHGSRHADPPKGWSADVFDQVTTILAEMLIRDFQEHGAVSCASPSGHNRKPCIMGQHESLEWQDSTRLNVTYDA